MAVANPELAAGDLDKRVTLLRPVLSEFEDEITGWDAIADVWAAVEFSGGREVNEAGRTVATLATTVTIRYRTDVDPRCRVQDGPRLYQILGINDVVRRNAALVLTCEEVL